MKRGCGEVRQRVTRRVDMMLLIHFEYSLLISLEQMILWGETSRSSEIVVLDEFGKTRLNDGGQWRQSAPSASSSALFHFGT